MANMDQMIPIDVNEALKGMSSVSSDSADSQGRVKITKRRHPDYVENIERWQFFIDSYIGGQKYVNQKDYLFKHPLEKALYYKQRQKRSYYYNYCKPIVNIFSNYLFSQAVIRDKFGDNLTEWMENVNGKGMSIDKFSEIANILSSVMGTIYGFVDAPPLNEANTKAVNAGKATRSLDRGFKVNAKFIFPMDLLDWSVDENGYKWILLAEKSFDDDDPQMKRVTKKWVKLWTREGWTLFNEKGNPEDTGTNPLGEIPIVKLTHVDFDINKVGESLLEDVAYVNRSVYNWASLLDEILYRQSFSQLVIQGDAADFEGLIISTAAAFNYPTGTNKPEYISPDASQASLFQTQIENAIVEMHRMAQLRLTGAQGERYKSILENTYDFNDTNVSLKNKARVMMKFEEQLFGFVAKWRNLNESEIGTIKYPQEFDTVSLTEDIDDAIKLATMQMGQTFNTMLKKRIVSKKFPDITQEEIKLIDTELMMPTEIVGEDVDAIGKIPLAIQQLALARERASKAGDTKRAEQLASKIDELLEKI